MKHVILASLYFMFSVYGSHSLAAVNTFDNLDKLSCYDLMSRLVKSSQLSELFNDKSMVLDFSFERYNSDYITLVLVTIDNPEQNSVYANFELNLIDFSLYGIDPEPSMPIKIHKQYVPFIKEKCTPEENVYINTGRRESYD